MLPSIFELLRDILRETEFLEAEVSATTREAFLADEVLKRAFVRSVEVIGGAARQVPEAERKQLPSVEWKKMAGMRDRLIFNPLRPTTRNGCPQSAGSWRPLQWRNL